MLRTLIHSLYTHTTVIVRGVDISVIKYQATLGKEKHEAFDERLICEAEGP